MATAWALRRAAKDKEEHDMLAQIEAWVALVERFNRVGNKGLALVCRNFAKGLANTVENHKRYDEREDPRTRTWRAP